MSALISWYSRRTAAYSGFVGTAMGVCEALEKGRMVPAAAALHLLRARAELEEEITTARMRFDEDLDKAYPDAVPKKVIA